jgi:hypothetical protein
MSVPQVDVREYGYFADSQWRHAHNSQFFEAHEPYSGRLFAVSRPALAKTRALPSSPHQKRSQLG